MELKDEFMSNTRNLWKGNYSDKRNGSIFNFEAAASKEIALTVSPIVNLNTVPDAKSRPRVSCSDSEAWRMHASHAL